MIRKHLPKLTRDGFLLVVGVLGLIHETLLQHGPERPSLIFIFGVMIGLPVALHKDGK